MVSPTPIWKQKCWSNWEIFSKFKTLKSEPNFLKYQSIQTVPKKSQVLENDDTEILIWKTMEKMGNHLPLKLFVKEMWSDHPTLSRQGPTGQIILVRTEATPKKHG